MSKSKRQRFEEIAARRVQRILDSMDSLAKCANKGSYEYSDSDVKKMMAAIKERMRNLEFAYTQKGTSGSNKFKF
ncbi:MAG TPA: hypothetical protein VNJ07_12165 [Chitinophagales bacterium]|nr:hypothetical protein [Chitinophagales bacterium]